MIISAQGSLAVYFFKTSTEKLTFNYYRYIVCDNRALISGH